MDQPKGSGNGADIREKQSGLTRFIKVLTLKWEKDMSKVRFPFLGAAAMAAVFLTVAAARAEDFSLHGVRFGMTKAEVDAVWVPFGDGTYIVPQSPIQSLSASFDHQDRIYEVSFTLELKLTEPTPLVAQAFQNVFQQRWGNNPDLTVNVSVGQNIYKVNVGNKRMREAYVKKIEEEISSLLKP